MREKFNYFKERYIEFPIMVKLFIWIIAAIISFFIMLGFLALLPAILFLLTLFINLGIPILIGYLVFKSIILLIQIPKKFIKRI